MTHDRAAFLEFNRGVRRAADDYNEQPSEFNDLRYCTRCSRIPSHEHRCETCQARLRMQKGRAS